MKLHNIAFAIAVAAGGIVAAPAFAQADVTITRSGDDGTTVTKRVREDADGSTHRVTRVDHPDGTTTVRRAVRTTNPDGSTTVRRVTRHKVTDPARRTVVIHRDAPARHVVVRTERNHRPAAVVNRRVTVIHEAG